MVKLSKRAAIMSAIILSLAGCASRSEAIPLSVARMVPYHVYCDVTPPAKPKLPIADLKLDAPPAENQRAYAQSIAILKSAVEQRDALLKSCRAPEKR
jgi:hypothetical protein